MRVGVLSSIKNSHDSHVTRGFSRAFVSCDVICGYSPAPMVSNTGIVHDLREELVCPVCQEVFDNPRFLPCHHYYCKRCIERLVAASGGPGTPFPCPECRTQTLLPEGGLDQLCPAFLVNRVKDSIERARDKKPAASIHNDPSPPPSTLAPPSAAAISYAYACKKHDSVLKLYCFDCQKLICAECALSLNHRGHNYKYIKESARGCRDSIMHAVADLMDIRKVNGTAVEQVEQRIGEVTEQSTSVQNYINRSFDDIISAVEQRRSVLLYRLCELTESKMTSLNEQKKTLHLANENIDQLVAMVTTLFDMPDEEFMNSQYQLLSLVKMEASAHNPSMLEPSEMANIVAEVSVGDVSGVCQSCTRVYIPVYGTGVSAPEVNKLATFTISPATPRNRDASVMASLVSVANKTIVPVTVSKQNNTYIASYVPMVRGRYLLTVSIDGEPHRAIPVFVRAMPENIFHTWKGLTGPTHVDFTSNGQIVISEQTGNRVGVLYQNQYSPLKDNFTQPCGVAVDQYNNIYVSETKVCRLSKFNQSGNLIMSVGGRSGRGLNADDLFVAPAGIKMVRNKLYVCDMGKSIIRVFDHGFNLMDFICTNLGRGVTDITSSPAGYLYVTQTEPPCVQVFTLEHSHLHSIRHEDLRYPSGVCFDDHQQLLYVCDSTSNCIFMFRHDGKYVMKTSIVEGSQLKGPRGIKLDEDGYLYVCDTGNNRVLIL